MSTTIASITAEAKRLGWSWVIGYRILKRFGIKDVRFRPRGLSTPIYVRIEGSDIYEYKQSLGSWAEPLRLPFTPRTIVDLGANVGYTALRWAKEFPNAKIIAVEPAKANLLQFEKNCGSSYQNISVIRGAVWPRSVLLRIADLGADHNAFQMVEDVADGNIQGITIPQLMGLYALERIDLLKVDIEGGELPLFNDPSAREWLRHVGVVLIETHDRMILGCSEAVRRAMEGLGKRQGDINEYEYWVLNDCIDRVRL